MNQRNMRRMRGAMAMALILAMMLVMAGCDDAGNKGVKLDPQNPITITVWHYYNGAILNAFESMIKAFNETVGMESGIIVEAFGMGSVDDLEKAVIDSANKVVGSNEMPDIFASYADTAYEAERLGILANLDDYFTKEEQAQYLPSYIEEGKIGLKGELRIFPIAKSTEMFMLNDTDWKPFAADAGLTYDDLTTGERLAHVAELYYNWTDAKTPDVPNDGRAFYGRDSMANFFIIASKEFGTEIFKVTNGVAAVQINEEVMRKIWDYYYVPFISGYYAANGRYRSDDAKVGDLLAYVGSTSSAAYFPKEVTRDDQTYPIDYKVMPAPYFEGGKKVMVQQGAGMVVVKSTAQAEYASVEFLKWFTEKSNNVVFSGLSGYLPVKTDALEYDTIMNLLSENQIEVHSATDDTIKTVLAQMKESELYTNKAFTGGTAARGILTSDLQDKAKADRAAVVDLLASGTALGDAVAQFNTDEQFEQWVAQFKAKLEEAAKAE